MIAECELFTWDMNNQEVLDRAYEIVEKTVQRHIAKHGSITQQDINYYANRLSQYPWNNARLVNAILDTGDEMLRLIQTDNPITIKCVDDLTAAYKTLAGTIWIYLFTQYSEIA